jgi:hypothetical protein
MPRDFERARKENVLKKRILADSIRPLSCRNHLTPQMKTNIAPFRTWQGSAVAVSACSDDGQESRSAARRGDVVFMPFLSRFTSLARQPS